VSEEDFDVRDNGDIYLCTLLAPEGKISKKEPIKPHKGTGVQQDRWKAYHLIKFQEEKETRKKHKPDTVQYWRAAHTYINQRLYPPMKK